MNPATQRRSALTRLWLLPPAWFLVFNALLVALDRLWPIAQLTHSPWSFLGWVPILIGCGLCLTVAWRFRRRHTTFRPFYESSALLTTGVFRRSRNPAYVGLVLAMAGVAFNAGSLSVWVVPPLFAAFLQWRFIRAEECMLGERFGTEYEAYRKRVRRWV